MNQRTETPCRSVFPVIVFVASLLACLLGQGAFCEGDARAQDDVRAVSALNAAGAIRGDWRIAGNNSVITIVCDTIRRNEYPNLLCFGYLSIDDLPEYGKGDVVFWVQNSQPRGTRAGRDMQGNAVEEYLFGFPLADFFWGQECRPGYRGNIDTYSMEHLHRGKYPFKTAALTIRLQGSRLQYESHWQEVSGPRKQTLLFERYLKPR